MVVQRDVAVQGLLQVLAGPEVVCAQQVGDTPVEALDHPISLRVARGRQASNFGSARTASKRCKKNLLLVGVAADAEFDATLPTFQSEIEARQKRRIDLRAQLITDQREIELGQRGTPVTTRTRRQIWALNTAPMQFRVAILPQAQRRMLDQQRRRRCQAAPPGAAAGGGRRAGAITTALSPDSTMSMPMICSRAIQNAAPEGKSCMGKAVAKGRAF